MTDKNVVKKSVTAARGWVTRSVNSLESALLDPDKFVLEAGMATFDSRLANLDEVQTSYELLLDDADIAACINEAADFRDKAVRSRVAATKICSLLLSGHDEEEGPEDAASSSSALKRMKLPKLELPKFTGDVCEWQTFKDQFEAAVHDSDLPNVTKFTYLRSLLSEEPKKVIDGLALTNANYSVARGLLEERYEKKEQVIFMHMQGLLNLSTDSRGSKLSQLRDLLDKTLIHIRSLETLGIEGKTYGVVLTPVILSRLPADIRMEWSRKGKGYEGNLEFLLRFLQEEVELRDRSEIYKPVTSKVTQVHNEKRRGQQSTASALQVQSADKGNTSHSSNSNSVIVCGFCYKQSHKSASCYSLSKLSPEERHAKIKEAKLCFKCLSPSHMSFNCKAKCAKCNGAHHKLCCKGSVNTPPKPGNKQDQYSGASSIQSKTESTQTSAAVSDELTSHNTVSQYSSISTVFQLADVEVVGKHSSVKATVLFDSGSDYTYITGSLVKKLSPTFVGSRRAGYAPFGGGQTKPVERNIFELKTKGKKSLVTFKAMEVPVICAPLRKGSVPSNVFDQFENCDMAFDYSAPRDQISIDILVGLDCYWQLVGQTCLKLSCGLVAQDTLYGWILSGNLTSTENDHDVLVSHQLLNLTDVPENVMRNFWNLEGIGISSKEADGEKPSEFLANFQQDIDYVNGRYQVPLLWKAESCRPNLMDNRSIAESRLNSLSRRLRHDQQLDLHYNAALCEMEHNGVIEEVTEAQVPYPVFYLPHHPVVRESSTSTKVRPVFDASCPGKNNVSLNDCLESGPSLLPDLVGVLLRFRRWRFALTGDITKAFLQIGLKREHQDVHRFLWEQDGVVRIMRFVRVTFGVKCSPFLLNAVIKHHLSFYPASNVIKELNENLYVDDWLTGADTEKKLFTMFMEAKSIMLEASMVLSKWSSTSTVVCEKLDSFSGGEYLKILGVVWSPEKDYFSFQGIVIPMNLVITKRVILSCIARIYDPLGFLSPVVMVAKRLFQELWMLGLGWDDEVPEDLNSRFTSWLEDISFLKQWSIPRSFFGVAWQSVKGQLQLHAFGDASEKAYGAVLYIRAVLLDGTIKTLLVMSKSRVAPVKKISLPRLELLGSLLAARLLCFVRKALQLPNDTSYFCWSDSMVTLAWIKSNPHKWKPFVANRITEIQELTEPSKWRFCRGKDNPADLTTRGLSAEQFMKSELWFHGPTWLCDPVDDFLMDSFHKSDKVEPVCEAAVMVTSDADNAPVVEFSRYGSFSKALRVLAWVKRFCSNAKLPVIHRQAGDLSYVEINTAKTSLFKLIQNEVFSAELKSLSKGEPVSRSSSIYKLSPFLGDDGLLRIKGRLQLSDLCFEEKHPIILPKCHVSVLLVRFHHLLLKHAGVDSMIASLRDSYWILGVRYIAKRVKKQCILCQKQDAKACNEPVAPLPQVRVSEAPPFTVTGIDFAGPLFCVDLPKTKFYICLFTCGVIRAVHLELTDSLTAQAFLLAYRRFTARRGVPSIIYSDNAKTFKAGKDQLVSSYGHRSPEWRFIAPRSPWWGGWWERLVRSVKSALKKSVGKGSLSRVELETTLIEVESCINSRPLTFVGDSIDYINPLCPNHFLLGRRVETQADVIEDEQLCTRQVLITRNAVRFELLNKFWKLWKDQYLRGLPATVHKFFKFGDLQVGSVVLVREDNVPRMKWELGVVTELIPSRDGIVRSVMLRTPKGPRMRAIQRIHNLEIVDSSSIALENVNTADKSISVSPQSDDCTSELDYNIQDADKVLEPKSTDNVLKSTKKVQMTRSGRVVRPVQRLDL